MSRSLLSIYLALISTLASPVLIAQDSICPKNLDRPCVALVLGGGGARGGAHIGVIRALEEYQIPVDMVVGTSIGAFVGGLYATGKNAEEMQFLFESADWNSGYKDALSRSEIPNRLKRQLDTYPIHLDIGFDGKSIKLPRGFIQGQAMKELIDSMLGSYPEFSSFDELPVAYRAVAADAQTGEEVVIDSGDLATAMQTSMSLPGILRPIERDGRMLVDGGIANNIPVSVAKSLGADIVIAVDIGAQGAEETELTSSFAILRQLTSFLTRQNINYQRSLMTDSDILLEPKIIGVGLLSFDKTLDAMKAGYEEAFEKLGSSTALQALAAQHPKQPNSFADRHTLHIRNIELDNRSSLADRFILRRLDLKPNGEYALADINHAANRLYGLGTFSRITTSVDKNPDGDTLHVGVQEKEWGPTYLNFKLAFEDDFDSFSHYQAGFSIRRTNISEYGAEWFSAFEIGTQKLARTEFIWPLGNTDVFWNSSAEYSQEVKEYLTDGLSLGNVTIENSTASSGIGWAPVDKFELLLSAMRRDAEVEVPSILAISTGYDNVSAQQTGARFNLNYDSLDHPNFPRSGWKFSAELHRTRDEILGLRSYSSQIDAEYNAVLSIGRHSVRNLLRYQSTLGNDDGALLGSFDLGGFLNLTGHSKDSIFGQHVRFYSLVYYYELAENNFGAINLPLYFGFSAEAGNAWQVKRDIDYSDVIYSGSAFIGWDSPLGPAYFAYGRSDLGDKGLYFYLGGTF